MKTQSVIRTFLFMGVSALSVAFMPAVQAQNAPVTPSNPNGSAADSKSADSSVAEQHDASASTSTTPASAPDKTSSKDTTNSLDISPSTASTDSANKSATKEPTLANSNEREITKETASSDRFSDKHFLVKAAEGGMTEVELGQIAQQKASSPDVKQFGQHMVADHSKANEELKGIAQQKGVSIPTKLDTRHQAAVDRLNKLSGPDFDRAYVKDMVKDHQKDVAEFERASSSAQDPDVKAFASKTLTVIKEHLADVQSLQTKIK